MTPRPEPTAVNTAHVDASQNSTIIGVQGTLGTSDTAGTAQTLPIAVDPATGAIYVNSVGGQAGTNVNINSAGIQTGTLGTATVASDAGTSPFRLDGNQALWTNLGYKLDSTNDSVTAILDGNGTVSVLTNLTSGSVRMTVGTLTTGTLQNLVSGTINALATGTLTGGTLQNLVSGTINALASGTITAGTVVANPAGFTYFHIAGAGTTVIKASAGTLHATVINSKSVGGVLSLYESNGTTGALIAAIDTTLSTTAFLYDIAFGSLTAAHVGATGGDITLSAK